MLNESKPKLGLGEDWATATSIESGGGFEGFGFASNNLFHWKAPLHTLIRRRYSAYDYGKRIGPQPPA